MENVCLILHPESSDSNGDDGQQEESSTESISQCTPDCPEMERWYQPITQWLLCTGGACHEPECCRGIYLVGKQLFLKEKDEKIRIATLKVSGICYHSISSHFHIQIPVIVHHTTCIMLLDGYKNVWLQQGAIALPWTAWHDYVSRKILRSSDIGGFNLGFWRALLMF